MGERATELRLGWRIVLAGATGCAVGISALPFYTLGIFTKAVASSFHWSREAVQWGFTCQMLAMAACGWIWGLAADRAGPRRVALISQLGFAVALAVVAAAQGPWSWRGAWVLLAVLGGGTSPVTWTRGVAGWFDRARGAALGFTLLGTGVTAVVAPPLVSALVAAHGWRAGYLALAASVIVIGLPVCWALFRDPPPPRASAEAVEAGRSEALADPRFWVIFAVFAAISFAIAGLISALVPLLTDVGVSPGAAARYASLAGLAIIAGRGVAGLLLDRVWAPLVAVGFLALPAAACLLLLRPDLLTTAQIGLAAGLCGLAAGAEFDLVAFLVSRYFGLRHYGLLYAIQMLGLLLSAGFAPPVFARVHDLTGSYAPMLQGCAAVFALAPLALLALGRYPRPAPAVAG